MKVFLYGFAILMVGQLAAAINHGVARENWDAYCSKFSSVYTECSQTASSSIAQMYYNYNSHLLEKLQTRSTDLPYTVAENQFTGMRYKQYKALFPLAARATAVGDPDITPAATDDSYPRTPTDVTALIFDQGIKCNAGWAYATANAMALYLPTMVQGQTLVPLSAQRLIDCVGGKTCKNESPRDAFLYLMMDQPLPSVAVHPNTPEKDTTGSCMQLSPDLVEFTDYFKLQDYVAIPDPTEAQIKNAIFNGYSVVVEVDPTSFEFMHYSTGVFQQPANKKEKGSHFMVAVGYGTDAANQLPYWDLVNSFGTTWGGGGKMRLDRATKIRSAYIPML